MREQVLKLRKALEGQGIEVFLGSSYEARNYLSGFRGSAGYVVVSKELQDLATDFRYFEQAPLEAPEFQLVKTGMDYSIIDYIKERGFKKIAFEEKHMTAGEYLNMISKLPEVEFVYGSDMISKIRQIKTTEEIEGHKKSCEVTNKIVEEFFNYVKVGMTERELHQFVLETSQKYGVEAQNFDPITLVGENSSFCHGKPTDRKVKEGDFILLDMGVVYKGYGSDVTRTMVMGKANDKQKEIHEIVCRAQKEAISKIRIGMTAYEAHHIAADIIAEAGYGDYFKHSLGHGFGDGLIIGGSEAAKSIVLKENMVFTVEPGIYVPGVGGVRIEDDVVLTKDGCMSFCEYGTEMREL